MTNKDSILFYSILYILDIFSWNDKCHQGELWNNVLISRSFCISTDSNSWDDCIWGKQSMKCCVCCVWFDRNVRCGNGRVSLVFGIPWWPKSPSHCSRMCLTWTTSRILRRASNWRPSNTRLSEKSSSCEFKTPSFIH